MAGFIRILNFQSLNKMVRVGTSLEKLMRKDKENEVLA